MTIMKIWIRDDDDKDFCNLPLDFKFKTKSFQNPGVDPSALVSCGNHQAQTCAACPQVIVCKTNNSSLLDFLID